MTDILLILLILDALLVLAALLLLRAKGEALSGHISFDLAAGAVCGLFWSLLLVVLALRLSLPERIYPALRSFLAGRSFFVGAAQVLLAALLLLPPVCGARKAMWADLIPPWRLLLYPLQPLLWALPAVALLLFLLHVIFLPSVLGIAALVALVLLALFFRYITLVIY